MRFLLKTFVFLLLVVALLAAVVLAWGHVHIRRIEPQLPAVASLLEADREAELPVRLTWINTASQRMPRKAVLDADRDPSPEADYVMSHPSFVVEWQDGRIFLVDLGMEPADAMEFGLPMEMVVGASPMQPHQSASARLGENRERVAGIGFTHLHTDHTSGLDAFCRDRLPPRPGQAPVALFQHHNQLGSVNHTTRGPKAQVQAADCVELRPLGHESGLLPISGFPGLFAIPVGGHTPGSTVWVVQLRVFPGESDGPQDDVQTWVITGDVVNAVDGALHGVRKPPLYSLLVVPEHDGRLAEARGFLGDLASRPGVKLLVNHDEKQLEKTGLPAY